jgi:vesicle coat complex subunit
MELITSTDVVRNLCKKMAPPLVTLLSAEPEIQYVALRNINLIVQKRPTILAHEIKVMHLFLFELLLVINHGKLCPVTQ